MNNFDGLFEFQRKWSRSMPNFNEITRFSNQVSGFMRPYENVMKQLNQHASSAAYRAILANQKIANQISVFERLQKIYDRIRNNPEIEFLSISELELLNQVSTSELDYALANDAHDEALAQKENLLCEFLIPYLEKFQLKSLWEGAEYALQARENPDRFRHALVSLRTIIEVLIERDLASNQKLSQDPRFEKEFRKFIEGKKALDEIKISRNQRIQYIASQVQFNILEFTEKDLNFICSIYEVLCSIHEPTVDLTENQMRILRI